MTIDRAVDTHCRSAIDHARDIITTIDIIDSTATNMHTGCITSRKEHTFDGFFINSLSWIHVCHTTATIDIIDFQSIRVHRQVDTFLVCHGTAVTTRIQVTYLTAVQVPPGTDIHRSLVVTTKHTRELVGITRGHIFTSTAKSVNTHGFQTFGSQFTFTITFLICLCYIIGNRTLIINTNICCLSHCGIVATAIEDNNRTATDFQIRLSQFWLHHTIELTRLRSIVIVAITTAKDLSNINLVWLG